MAHPPKLSKARYWATLFLTFVGPGGLAELSLYVLNGDFSAWHHVVAGIGGGLLSGILFLFMKVPQFDPIPQTVLAEGSPGPVDPDGDARGFLHRIRIFTPQKVGIVLLALVVIFVCLTVVDTPLGLWRWFNGENGVAALLDSGQSTPTRISVIPTATPLPTHVGPLGISSKRLNQWLQSTVAGELWCWWLKPH